MSRESHRRFLENAALREAQKTFDRKGRANFSQDDFHELRIQTVEPWKRIVVGLIGLLISGISASVLYAGYLLPGCGLAVLAIGTILFAAVGRKRPIDAVINGIDLADIIAAFFQAL